MTLGKRQRVIIWTFVILTVILLGLHYMAGENLKNEWGGIFAFKEYIAFYGIKIPWPRYHFLDGKTTDNNFLFWAESQKYLLIAVSALVGATLIITSKKK